MSSQSSELQQKKADIDAQMKDIAANIAQEAAKIKQYEEQIAKLNIQIEELDNKIAELSIQIDAKKIEIEENELEVEVLQSKVKDRMVASQPTMRLNIMIDFLMGADNFEDFIRRANGLKAITDYEEEIRVELKDLLIKLEDDKVQLASNQVSLEVDKADLVDKQNSVLATQYKAKLVREEFYRQEVELEEQSNQIAGDLEALQKMQKELAIKLGKVVSSSGFMRPITAGRISAGTWHYPSSFGGGIHLGVDYADSKGTPVYAPANGVIVNSVDGCKDGWLGNSCGGDGGVNMGGNQIYMVVSVDGKTYGLRFFHFLIGSPIATGTIVSQGDKIAETGTSGNSTGCHTHIEVIYLGTMTVAEYVADWNGSLSFNASWGSDAYYNRLCENGASAPCRIKPESVFE
jgi:murein DD-endopeptidase MepM/ murein hydrolase activator NlpD